MINCSLSLLCFRRNVKIYVVVFLFILLHEQNLETSGLWVVTQPRLASPPGATRRRLPIIPFIILSYISQFIRLSYCLPSSLILMTRCFKFSASELTRHDVEVHKRDRMSQRVNKWCHLSVFKRSSNMWRLGLVITLSMGREKSALF